MSTLAIEIKDAVGTQSKFWHIVLGEDIKARSETMYNKTDAVTTATHFKENPDAYTFEVINYNDRDYPFSWHAKRNGRIVVGATEKYTTYAIAAAAAEYIRVNIRWAPIVDLTVSAGSRR